MEYADLELYIQVRDGQPHEHPIFADNFRAAFPDIAPNDLPDNFAKFIRVAPPEIGEYEVYEGVTYGWVDGVVKDVHHVRPMTDEESAAKVEQMRQDRIAYINSVLAVETDDAVRAPWLDCLAAHEAWVMETANPITPSFPPFPRKNNGGSQPAA